MHHFITFGDDRWSTQTSRLCSQAAEFGFDTVFAYNDTLVEKDAAFCEAVKSVWRAKRGFGYWIWKPWVVNDALCKARDGDIIVYADAGCSIVQNHRRRYEEYVNMLRDKAVIRFHMDFIEEEWTCDAMFDHFQIEKESDIRTSGQYMASVLILKVCDASRALIRAWLDAATNHPQIFSDEYNKSVQRANFKDHRHDQSALSILSKLEPFAHTIVRVDSNDALLPFLVTRFRPIAVYA